MRGRELTEKEEQMEDGRCLDCLNRDIEEAAAGSLFDQPKEDEDDSA